MHGDTRILEKTPASAPRGARTVDPAAHARVSAPLSSHTGAASPVASGGAANVRALQRLVGNQAVMRMLDARRTVTSPAAAVQAHHDDEDEVQRDAAGLAEPSDQAIRSAAAEGVRTPSSALPFADRIQASFGRHPVGQVQAHVGPAAAEASRAMNATAYASGDHVVFGGSPDLRTAAHEAAHVVQQRAGVQLAGGVGRAGDPYERHADAVAGAVVAGQSAEALLEPFSSHDHNGRPAAAQRMTSGLPVQRTITVGENVYEDGDKLGAALQNNNSVEWKDEYLPVLQGMSQDDAVFESMQALMLAVQSAVAVLSSESGNLDQILIEEHKEEEHKEEEHKEEEHKEEAHKEEAHKEDAQDTPLDPDLQAMLGIAYWKGKLGKGFLQTQMPNYWKTYAGPKKEPKTPKRTVDEILKEVGPDLLQQLETVGEESTGQLRLYRTMPDEEATAIVAWYHGQKENTEAFVKTGQGSSKLLKTTKELGILPVAGHLGDLEQAQSYYEPGKNTIVEFTLKPGAHDLLFSPDYMALARSGRDLSVVAEAEKQSHNRIFPDATANEGNLPGYVGVKPEKRGAFSLNMGDADPTHLLFQLFVKSVRKVNDPGFGK